MKLAFQLRAIARAQPRPLVSTGRHRMPAAFRLPAHAGQLVALPVAAPHLFVHEGTRQAIERRFMMAYRGPVQLSITDNRHAIVSHGVRQGVMKVRLHHMFLSAPPRVQRALVAYVVLGCPDASRLVGHFIDDNAALLRRRPHPAIPLQPRGKHHDLREIQLELDARYFGSGSCPPITWGRRSTATSGKRKTIRLGSYDSSERVIRIHPVLDRVWVPRYFVASVVFHEMLHHLFPAAKIGRRRSLHPPEFLERERQFRMHERALAWQRKNLARLLRA